MSNLYHGHWYWRVRSTDSYIASNWGGPFELWVDTVPPVKITALSALTGTNNGEIDISWIAPFDDGKSNKGENYYIKYAAFSIEESNWEYATPIVFPPSPGNAGTSQEFTITEIDNNAFYYIGIKTGDETDNISDISNIACSSTNFTPSVTVVYPAGGEELSGNVRITWSYRDVNAGDTHSIDISASDNGGISYDTVISSSLAGETTFYIWNTVELANGIDYKVKVFVTDNKGLTGMAFSGNFTVSNNNIAPSIAVLSPDGGENWSDTRIIEWEFSDENGKDRVFFDIYISSDGGNNWILEAGELYKNEGLNNGTTNYKWDTTPYPDGCEYKVKVVGNDTLLAGEDTSNGSFILFNINDPPDSFSLIAPAPGEMVNILTPAFDWSDSDDKDISLGDSFTYTLWYSAEQNFFSRKEITALTCSSHTLKENLTDNITYWWKVKAVDGTGGESWNSGGANWFYVKWASAESSDEKVKVSVNANMPEDGYIDISKITEDSSPEIFHANVNSKGDPLLRAISSYGYLINVKHKNTGEALEADNLTSRITLRFEDKDNNNYDDKSGIHGKYLRIFRVSDEHWRLASTEQSVDPAENTVTASGVKGLSLFSIQAYSPPDGLLSDIRNFPNPFKAGSEETEIVYTLTADCKVKICIYTLSGDLVLKKNVYPGDENGGKGIPEGFTNHVYWNGRNGNGKYLSQMECIYWLSRQKRKQAAEKRKKRD